LVAIEAGWWFTEVGRQPWILRNFMTTQEAATTSGNVDLMIILFGGLYLILGIGTIVVLTRMFRRNPVEQELAQREEQKGGEQG
jgi:cytochrome d ubiquinol oxidase subunit I